MNNAHLSKDHTDPKSGDEISYSFVHDAGLASGGKVKILAFNESKFVESTHGMKHSMPLGELEVHKDALISFVASLVRRAKASQLKELNDLQVLGL